MVAIVLCVARGGMGSESVDASREYDIQQYAYSMEECGRCANGTIPIDVVLQPTRH